VWVDDQFNGTGLNSRLWEKVGTPEGRKDGELETYSPAQVTVSDGMLRLTAQLVDGRWLSGEIQSRWDYRYGTYSFRARVLGLGQGIWPAGWLRGVTGASPHDGEIDALEETDRHDWDLFTVHGPTSRGGAWQVSHRIGSFSVADWHTYSITKTATTISLSVDGRHVSTVSVSHLPKHAVWPYDTNSYQAVLDVAVGGNWPGAPSSATPRRAVMEVDWYTVTAP
jgi:beta-glucanase (GH16 family)